MIKMNSLVIRFLFQVSLRNSVKYFLVLIFLLFINPNNLIAQSPQDSANFSIQKTPKFKMTSLAFGGTGVLMSKVKNQFSVFTGGRGSATFNNRFTFGGGGWGMPKGIEIPSSKIDTFEFFKFGYGGLEFGYIIYPGERFKFGANILLAYGAGFMESVPKSKGGDFQMFPVIEPSIYMNITLSKLLLLDIGAKYRYVSGTHFPKITNQQMSGFAFYVAFLVGTCSCE